MCSKLPEASAAKGRRTPFETTDPRCGSMSPWSKLKVFKSRLAVKNTLGLHYGRRSITDLANPKFALNVRQANGFFVDKQTKTSRCHRFGAIRVNKLIQESVWRELQVCDVTEIVEFDFQ